MSTSDEPDFKFGGFDWYVEVATEGYVTRPCHTRAMARAVAKAIDDKIKATKNIDQELAAEQILAEELSESLPEGWVLLYPFFIADGPYILVGPHGVVRGYVFAAPDEAVETAWALYKANEYGA